MTALSAGNDLFIIGAGGEHGALAAELAGPKPRTFGRWQSLG